MINPSQYAYYPYNAYAANVQNAAKPKSSVDSVRIDIVNPKVSNDPGIQMPQAPVYYPPGWYYGYQNPVAPVNTAQTPAQPPVQPPVQQQPQQPKPEAQKPQDKPKTEEPKKEEPKKEEPKKEEPKKEEPKKEEKPKFGNIPEQLIKSIETGLNDPSPDIRLSAATKLADTYEKNPESGSHPALSVLLNRVLADPHQNVRAMGEIAMQVGANGNENTKGILGDLVKSNGAFGQDAATATKILMDLQTRKPPEPPPAETPPEVPAEIPPEVPAENPPEQMPQPVPPEAKPLNTQLPQQNVQQQMPQPVPPEAKPLNTRLPQQNVQQQIPQPVLQEQQKK